MNIELHKARMVNYSSIAIGAALGVFVSFFISGFHLPEVATPESKAVVEGDHTHNSKCAESSSNGIAPLPNAEDLSRSVQGWEVKKFLSPESSSWRVSHLGARGLRTEGVEGFGSSLSQKYQSDSKFQPTLSSFGMASAVSCFHALNKLRDDEVFE